MKLKNLIIILIINSCGAEDFDRYVTDLSAVEPRVNFPMGDAQKIAESSFEHLFLIGHSGDESRAHVQAYAQHDKSVRVLELNLELLNSDFPEGYQPILEIILKKYHSEKTVFFVSNFKEKLGNLFLNYRAIFQVTPQDYIRDYLPLKKDFLILNPLSLSELVTYAESLDTTWGKRAALLSFAFLPDAHVFNTLVAVLKLIPNSAAELAQVIFLNYQACDGSNSLEVKKHIEDFVPEQAASHLSKSRNYYKNLGILKHLEEHAKDFEKIFSGK